ncbi:MAG: H-type lectin domain-containing protein [Pseudomonadota bacterium]
MDQGEVLLFSHFENGGKMWSGEGQRTIRKDVKFSERFIAQPAVHVSLCMFDLDSKSNPRAEVLASRITNDSFDVVFRTWGDTRVARVRVAWLAIGPVAHQDDWDLY